MGKLKKLASGLLASKPSGLPARRVLGNQRGVAIIEVLIAGVVLAIAIIGLALMFSSGETYVVAEGDERVAIYLAQQKIEELRSKGWGSVPIGTVGESAVSGFPRYSRTTVVKCVNPNDPSLDVNPCGSPRTAIKISVTVSSVNTKDDEINIESFLTLH